MARFAEQVSASPSSYTSRHGRRDYAGFVAYFRARRRSRWREAPEFAEMPPIRLQFAAGMRATVTISRHIALPRDTVSTRPVGRTGLFTGQFIRLRCVAGLIFSFRALQNRRSWLSPAISRRR